MKRIAVVSDLHCGSIYGLLPPRFQIYDESIKEQNSGQRYLFECWQDYCDRARTFEPHAVIVNGDVVDGPQRKNQGSELSLISPDDQVRAAIDTLGLLRRKCPKAKFFFTQGTPYHVGEWNGHEEAIAAAIGAEEYKSVGTGRLCREILWLELGGVIVEAAHHISVAQGFYRLTPLDREMQWSALSAKDSTKGVPKADLLIRSHVHHFSYGEHASKQGLTTPCWQLQTRYMRKNSVGRMLPDIGGLFIEVDGQAKKRGEAPCRIIKELYSLPPAPLTDLATSL